MATVKELRDRLVEEFDYTKAEVGHKGEKELVQVLAAAELAKQAMDSQQMVRSPEDKSQNLWEQMGAAGWTDYVLTLLEKSEKDECGNPKVDALRRIATRLFGPFDITSEVVQTPHLENAGRATVIVTVNVGGVVSTGSADVFSGNTQAPFCLHPVATAETRAEGRALRKALRLTKVLSAEELQGPSTDEVTGADGRAPKGMTNAIIEMAKKVQVDAFRLAKTEKMPINDLSELTISQARTLATKLNKFFRKEESIPDEARQ